MTKWRQNTNRFRQRENGFTLIELAIVFGVVSLLSVLFIYNFREAATSATARNQIASIIVSDIRRAQSMALAGSNREGQIVCGFGIHYINSYSYILYSKMPSGGSCALATRNYSSGDPFETRIIDNTNFRIGSIFADIFFEPPDPKTYINNSAVLLPETTTTINVVLKNQPCTGATCTIVTVSTRGSVDVN